MPVQWPVQLADGGLIRPSSTSSGSRRSRFDDLRSFVIGLCTFQATQDSTRRRPETRGHEYADQGVSPFSTRCFVLQSDWNTMGIGLVVTAQLTSSALAVLRKGGPVRSCERDDAVVAARLVRKVGEARATGLSLQNQAVGGMSAAC